MPLSEKKKASVRKYQSKFDRLTVKLKNEDYNFIKEKAQKRGMSINSYVISLLENA